MIEQAHRKAEHYARLLGVTREGVWEPCLLYMLEAVAETSRWTLAKLEAIRALLQPRANTCRQNLSRPTRPELFE